jgi:hypothetical protein
MKRSEMIEIIDKAYTEWVNMFAESNMKDVYTLPNLYEYLLDAIEAAGMTPPFCQGLYNTNNPNLEHGRKWEPEDDEI